MFLLKLCKVDTVYILSAEYTACTMSAGERHFYGLDYINSFREGHVMIEVIMQDLCRCFHRQFSNCTIAELEVAVALMNEEHKDFGGNRIGWFDFLGGLVHIQLSHRAIDPPWLIVAQRPEHQLPVDRMGCNYNGLVCSRAPIAAQAAWLSSHLRNLIILTPGGAAPIDIPECAMCGTTTLPLQKCGRCSLVRYCGRACQTADYRVRHRALCKWVQSCHDQDFGPIVERH